jgi:hypothetical protein
MINRFDPITRTSMPVSERDATAVSDNAQPEVCAESRITTVHYCTVLRMLGLGGVSGRNLYLRAVFFVVVDKGDIRVRLYNVINRYGRLCISV